MIDKMLEYLYLLDYEEDSAGIPGDDLIEHAAVYVAGEKYGIQGLKIAAAEKFRLSIETHIIRGELYYSNAYQIYEQLVEIIYTGTLESDRELLK